MNHAAAAVRPHPEQVARAFLTPRAPRKREALAIDGGEAFRVATPDGGVSLLRAGTGPAVLLFHGWEGQASDMTAFVEPILDAGFGVLEMDLPAHGASDGTSARSRCRTRAPQLRQRALFIHSSDDQIVAIEESLEGAAAWPGARHLRFEGLGHRRLLRDPAVIDAAIAFVTIIH